jgi:hypothetical protein
MNHLEQLKQKMMIKPAVQERERVAVIIKGEKSKKTKQKINEENEGKEEKEDNKGKENKTIGEQLEEGILDLSEQVSDIQKLQGILPDIDVLEPEQAKPVIIDKTDMGYDREALLKKLTENKKIKVSIKQNVKNEERVIEQEPVPIKKAKKIP